VIDIQTFLQEQNQPDYREQQFNRAYYQQYISSFDELTTWSKDLRAQLKASHDFSSLKLQQRQVSAKKDTIKALFSLRRDRRQQVESVLMRHQDGRNTVCVSCMVGCPVACSFCATGQMGLRLNLRAREIIDQILYFARWLQAQQSQDQSSAERLTNIVFMGMGEPMLNLPAVEQAINTIINPEQMGFSQRRITVSTVGYPEQITQFVDDGYDQVRLAISLHAPTQELRTEIMPIAKVFPLEQLFKAIDYYVGQCNKLVSYEYLLLAGVNDQPQQARQLGQLLQKRLAHVNLIPFNPVPGIKYQRPHPQQVKRFAQVLDQAGISNSIRVTMGKDIDAACGQLSSANS
jgi:23S rRNA (adenine2503-C2)-methyltransferase